MSRKINDGSVTLTTKWARGILKSLDWAKRRGKTAKREMNSALYEELKFTWKRKIANPQTPLGFTTPNKATFAEKGAKSVPIANVDDKRQITGTFSVNISGEFLPFQLIYSGVTDRCHPKVKFLANSILPIVTIIGLMSLLLSIISRR